MPQAFYGSHQGVDHVIDIRFGVVLAKAEPNRAARQLFVASEGTDYRRRFKRSRRASGAGRSCHALHVEMNQEAFAFDKAKGNVREMRQATIAIAVKSNLADPAADFGFKPITKAPCVFVASISF